MSIDYQRLERNLAREFRQRHVAAQVYRVAGVFLTALVLQLKDGWHDWTLKGVYSLVLAAGYGTLRHYFPQVSWKLVLEHLHWAQAAAVAAQQATDTAAATPVPPASDATYTPVTAPAAKTPPAVAGTDSSPPTTART